MFFIQVSFIWLLQQSLQRLAVVPNLNKVGQTWRLQQRSFPSICCSRTTWVSFAEIPIQLNLSRPCPFLALGPVGVQQSRPSHLFTIPSAEFPASCAFVQWCLFLHNSLWVSANWERLSQNQALLQFGLYIYLDKHAYHLSMCGVHVDVCICDYMFVHTPRVCMT